MPAALKAIQLHFEVKKRPGERRSQNHQRVLEKGFCNADSPAGNCVSQLGGDLQGPEQPEQVRRQDPITKMSDFHLWVEELFRSFSYTSDGYQNVPANRRLFALPDEGKP